MSQPKQSPHSTLSRLAAPLALVLVTQAPAMAQAAGIDASLPTALSGPSLPLFAVGERVGNRIDGLTVEELDDGTTVLRVQGTRKPTFNVYRLSSPDRLVVDIAGSERGKVVPFVPLDTWACGRVTVDGVSERDAKLVRLVIELKRESSYIVLPKDNELVVTVTPREIAPEAYFARRSAAERRADIERSARDARALEAEARALSSHAKRQAREVDRKVDEAAERAEVARAAEARAKAAERRATELETKARRTLGDAKSRKLKLRRALRQAETARADAEADRKRAVGQRKLAEGALAKARVELEAERASLKKARGEVEAERVSLQKVRSAAEADAAEAKAELAEARAKTQRADKEASRVLREARVELEQAQGAAKRAESRAKATLAKAEKAAARATSAATDADAAASKKLDEAAVSAADQLRRARADANAAETATQRKLAKAEAELQRVERETARNQAKAKKAEARAKALLAEARAKGAFEVEQVRAEAEREAKQTLAAAQRAEVEAHRRADALLASAEAEAKAKIAAATATAKREAKRQLAAAETEAKRRLRRAKREAERNAAAHQSQAVDEARRELGRLRAKADKEVARQVAAAKKKAEGEAEGDLEHARSRAATIEAEARTKLAQADSRLAEAEAEAQAKKQSAAALEREAHAALSRAERALAEAEAERKAAASARRKADEKFAATERRVRRAQRRGKLTHALERSLTEAKKAKVEAEGRLAMARDDLRKLEKDRDALERTLKRQRIASRALASKIAARNEELTRLEHEVADAHAELHDAGGAAKVARAKMASEGASLRERNAATQAELGEAEARLSSIKASLEAEQDKLGAAQQEVAEAQRALDARVARRETTLPPPDADAAGHDDSGVHAFVRDVRFEEDSRESRVIVEFEGPIHYEGNTLTPDILVLSLEGASIDPKLERSLDTSAYEGSIERITSFAESGGAKVIVATKGKASPRLEHAEGKLIWHFPHGKPSARAPTHEVTSLPGSKVGGYAAAPPPPMAAAHRAAMAPARSSGRSLGGVTPSDPQPRSRRGTRWRGERIDILLQDAPVKDVLLLFSDIGRVNIIAGTGVEGNVTMKLTAVPWDQALDIILRSLNLGMVREGNVIRVATTEALELERRQAIERANARVQLKPLVTRLLPISYATVDEMVPKVQSVLSPRGTVTPDSRTNTLIIMDVADNIAIAEQLVVSLDTQTPQVLIEARIVEARTSFQRQLGIQWGFDFTASPGTGNPTGLLFPNSAGIGGGATGVPTDARGIVLPGSAANPNYVVDLPAPVGTGAGGALGFSFGSISGNLNTNLRLSQAEETGEVRIISAPKIVTLDNSEAQIEQGVQIPISQVSAQGVNTRFVNATLSLRVTPHVTNEGAVLLDVQVQKNEADFINTGARGDPTILTKQAQSRMLVNDSDTAVIGGIYTRNKAVSFTKVPWLADIPIVGWFFKNKSEADTRSEVLIFITPKIVNRASSIGG